jgi:N-acetylmuramoyl-L-alanine amidase
MVLKIWQLIALAMLCAAALGGCSSPSQSAPEPSPDPFSYFISLTNRSMLDKPPAQTNVTILPVQPPTNALPQPSALPAVTPAPLPQPAPRTSRRFAGPTWVPCDAWSEDNGWGKPQRVRNVPTWTFELQHAKDSLVITAGNRTVLWNGINLELGFVPRLTNGQAYLHSLDLEKTLDPLTMPTGLFHKTNRVVVLDPGHGGDNYGAKSILTDHYEKEFALDWAFRLEPLLRQRGWKVYLTRTNDMDIPLADRVSFADSVQADLFISLHFNSSDQPQGRAEQGGIETYCLTPKGMPSTLTRRFEDEVGHLFPNNAWDLENYQFATRLHGALLATTQRKDRGVRRARFMGVLRGQNRPAVLLEGGYLTFPAEARLIGEPVFRQKLAEAVALGLSEP